MKESEAKALGLINKKAARRVGALPDPAVEAQIISEDISTEDLLGKTMEIVRREIKNLLIESASKKLASNSARDLVAYVKLLSELSAKQDELLKALSDDDLTKILKKKK